MTPRCLLHSAALMCASALVSLQAQEFPSEEPQAIPSENMEAVDEDGSSLEFASPEGETFEQPAAAQPVDDEPQMFWEPSEQEPFSPLATPSEESSSLDEGLEHSLSPEEIQQPSADPE